MNVAELGFTKEEIMDRIVDQCVSSMLSEPAWDDDGNEVNRAASAYRKEIDKLIRTKIDESINRVAEDHVLPLIPKAVEEITLQATNSWGEKKGEPISFIEYLVQRANAYITEEVNHDGKSKTEERYSWSKASTRIAYMVNKHLHFSISTAIEKALKSANSQIALGIEGAVKIQLEQLLGNIKCNVKV